VHIYRTVGCAWSPIRDAGEVGADVQGSDSADLQIRSCHAVRSVSLPYHLAGVGRNCHALTPCSLVNGESLERLVEPWTTA
jgi:hypothetical protein